MKTRIISFLSAAALLAGCYEDAGELGVDTATRIALSPAEIGFTADGTTVQLAFDVTEAYTVRQTQQRAYHTTFVILIAIGAAVSWVTSYLLTRPLGTLSRASRELARGNLSYRAPVRSRDEVGQLAADFNRMAGQLEQNVNRIQESMALQERFMADFSHEMKTPMTSIIGYAAVSYTHLTLPTTPYV